jgi:hypothetical protein
MVVSGRKTELDSLRLDYWSLLYFTEWVQLLQYGTGTTIPYWVWYF